jgi:predicted Zn-dependent protease
VLPRVGLPALVLLALGCATSATGRKQLLLVPNDEVRTMGEKAFVDVKSKSSAAKEPITNEYVRCVATTVLSANGATPSDWEIVVFQDDDVNAFALPGGRSACSPGC